MTEQDEDSEDEKIERETATPLPERDAMSIIAGPEKLIPVEGPVSPNPPESSPIGIVPPPRFNV